MTRNQAQLRAIPFPIQLQYSFPLQRPIDFFTLNIGPKYSSSSTSTDILYPPLYGLRSAKSKQNTTAKIRFCCPKFLQCQTFPLPTWWNLNHTGPQEMLLLWPRCPLFPHGNELHVTQHWSDSLHLRTGWFFQSCHFLAEISIPPFLNKSTSCFETQFLWEDSFTSASDIVCPVLNVCLSAYSSRGHGGESVSWAFELSMYTASIKCYTHSFLLINQIQKKQKPS